MRPSQSGIRSFKTFKIDAQKLQTIDTATGLNKNNIEVINEEQENEEDLNQRKLEAEQNGHFLCKDCNCVLSDEDIQMNSRLLDTAQQTGNEMKSFPLCIKCHFE